MSETLAAAGVSLATAYNAADRVGLIERFQMTIAGTREPPVVSDRHERLVVLRFHLAFRIRFNCGWLYFTSVSIVGRVIRNQGIIRVDSPRPFKSLAYFHEIARGSSQIE